MLSRVARLALLWIAGTVLTGSVLAGCSPFALLNAVATDRGYALRTGVAYASLPRHKLDLYLPERGDGNAPVVVFFYGGAWEGGSRQDYRFVGAALASRGVLTVIPDYRVYPEVVFPAFVEDGALAVKWVQDEISRFGGDGRRLYLMGHSAGAHIAAMLALNRQYVESAGGDMARVSGLIGLAGPYDFLPLKSATLKKIFGDPAPRLTQPIDFVTGGAPPALLITGAADTTVKPGNSERLAGRLRAAGGHVEQVVYPGIGHGRLIGAFSPALANGVPVVEDVLRFIHDS
jgi:acetyl esterase/lipase